MDRARQWHGYLYVLPFLQRATPEMFEQCHIEAARRHSEHAARAVIDKEIVRAHEAIFAADSRDRRKPERAARELSSVAPRDPAANPRDPYFMAT